MIILAIDPGYDKVGYSVFDKTNNSSYSYITSDLIKTSKQNTHEMRLLQIYEKLNSVITTYSPARMVVEQLFMFKNQKTVIQVAQAIGVIELLAAQRKMILERLTPLQIKQIVTGYGNADKKAVEKMVTLTLSSKIAFKDDDQVDAVACGLAYCLVNEALR